MHLAALKVNWGRSLLLMGKPGLCDYKVSPAGGGVWQQSNGFYFYFSLDGNKSFISAVPPKPSTSRPSWWFTCTCRSGMSADRPAVRPSHHVLYIYIPNTCIFLYLSGAPPRTEPGPGLGFILDQRLFLSTVSLCRVLWDHDLSFSLCSNRCCINKLNWTEHNRVKLTSTTRLSVWRR